MSSREFRTQCGSNKNQGAAQMGFDGSKGKTGMQRYFVVGQASKEHQRDQLSPEWLHSQQRNSQRIIPLRAIHQV